MSNFTKSILYSTTVLAAGLVAIFAIYNNVTTSPDGGVFAGLAPAAGEQSGESDLGINFEAEFKKAEDAVESVSTDIQQKTTSAVENNLADIATQAGDSVPEATAGLEDLAEKADHAKEAVEEKTTTTVETVTDAATDQVTEKAEEATDAVTEKAEEIVTEKVDETVTKKATDHVAEKTTEAVTEKAADVVESTQETVKETVIEKTEDKAGSVLEEHLKEKALGGH